MTSFTHNSAPQRRRFRFVSFLLGLFYAMPLRAAEEITKKTATEPVIDFTEATSTVMILLKVSGALLLVVGLIALLVIWLRKLGLSQSGAHQCNLIEVLDTKMIAPKKYVVVVKIAEKHLALGITDQQISMLTTLDESGIPSSPNSKNPAKAPFSTLLGKALNRNE